jgi:hypothetical protein
MHGNDNETPPAPASNGCSQPIRPAPKWAAPISSRPKSHQHCGEITSWVWSCARSPAVDARDPPPASWLGPGPARRAAPPPSATAPPPGDAAPAVPVGKVVGIGRGAFSGNMRVSFQAASHGLRSGRGRFVRSLRAEPGRSHPYPDSCAGPTREGDKPDAEHVRG